MDRNASIFVAGHRGMVGSAILRRLRQHGCENLITRTLEDLDLTDQAAVNRFFEVEQPAYVFLAAAEFLYENLAIQTNVIHAAYQHGARKLLFLGSSCIYPKLAPQPIREDSLLTGLLEPTNEWYAIAKIAGLKMVQAYRRQYGFSGISLMPTNLYGPGDNFDPQTSHVLPGLIQRFHQAKVKGEPEVVVWGTGKPRREFLHVDDLANAAVFLMENYDDEEIVNVGVGEDLEIGELARLVREIVGYPGGIVQDTSKPDGTPRKLLDVTKLRALGWSPTRGLREGIKDAYDWFLANHARGKMEEPAGGSL
jgi:GDP-L-fucose synthase